MNLDIAVYLGLTRIDTIKHFYDPKSIEELKKIFETSEHCYLPQPVCADKNDKEQV